MELGLLWKNDGTMEKKNNGTYYSENYGTSITKENKTW